MLLGLLLAVVILVCVALAAVVLLQRSEGGALGMGGGPAGFMTTRGAGDLLTRLTWILGSTLFGLCLLLTILQGRLSQGSSVVDRLKITPLSTDALAPRSAAPAAAAGQPAAPADDGFGPPAPTVSTTPSAAPAAAPATIAPGAVTVKPAARPAPRAAAPAAPAPTVTVAPAKGASPSQTPPGTGSGPTDPVTRTLGGLPAPDAATPAPKTN